jgi:uncharacterized membrane protein (DUF106 family)
MQERAMTGIRLELALLALFVALFVATLTLLNALLLPRHYNPIVVLLLASIIVGLLTILVRYLVLVRGRGPR